jgi:TatD DNase family protein
MNFPSAGDYIDIHNHGAKSSSLCFQVENLMTHENRFPDNETGLTYSIGIHPWFLTNDNYIHQISIVRQLANNNNIIALGETGFDRLKGPEINLQKTAFENHVKIAEEISKPLFIHCVRAWDELLSVHKKLKPSVPWLVHGFRGKKELAMQLISKGMYLSFWFDFVLKPESSQLVKELPKGKIFLETDGSGTDIKAIYKKVAADLDLSIDELRSIIFSNFTEVFTSNPLKRA